MTIIRNNEKITLSMEELRKAYEEYMTSSISLKMMEFDHFIGPEDAFKIGKIALESITQEDYALLSSEVLSDAISMSDSMISKEIAEKSECGKCDISNNRAVRLLVRALTLAKEKTFDMTFVVGKDGDFDILDFNSLNRYWDCILASIDKNLCNGNLWNEICPNMPEGDTVYLFINGNGAGTYRIFEKSNGTTVINMEELGKFFEKLN